MDSLLEKKLQAKGAVLIEGPKWCGKTTTAEEIAASKILLARTDVKSNFKSLLEIDTDAESLVRTVVPTRTFLEKLFLLAEEFQKEKPRNVRMSRHLYDLEKLMDTEYGVEALSNRKLYDAIVEHRKAYYALKYVNYELHSPSTINFTIPESAMEAWKDDYADMRQFFIYGESLEFDALLQKMRELQERMRVM